MHPNATMDRTFELVCCLDDQEEKKFRRLLSSGRAAGKIKELQLFDLLRKKKTAGIVQKLYGRELSSRQQHAYHQLRQSLSRKLEEFLLSCSGEEDALLKVTDSISLSRVLLLRKNPELAALYLKEAEQKAAKAEQFDLLNLISQLQAESGMLNPGSLQDLVRKREETAALAAENYNLTLTLSLIRDALRTSVFSGDARQVEELLKPVLKRLTPESDAETVIALRYKVTLIVFLCLKERGEYPLALSYLEKAYGEMEDRKMLEGHHRARKLELLTWLAGCSLKSRDMEKAVHYRELLEKESAEQEVLPGRLYTMISFDFFLVTGQPLRAEELLNSYGEHSRRLSGADRYYLSCSRALLAFIRRDYQAAIQYIFPLLSRKQEKAWSGFFGPRSVLVPHIAETILHYERGNFDFVETRLESIRKKFRSLIASDARVQKFLGIFTKLCKNPGIEKSAAFSKEVQEFACAAKAEIGSLEFISYSAWLKSRVEGRDYYTVYLELTGIPEMSREEEMIS
jgi:hypothetical protein